MSKKPVKAVVEVEPIAVVEAEPEPVPEPMPVEIVPDPEPVEVIAPALVYDGLPQVSSALRAAFPQAKVYANQSRCLDGTPCYNIMSGQNGFVRVPGGKVYFAGEEIK